MRIYDIILVAYLELAIDLARDLYKRRYRLVLPIVINRNNEYKVERVL